MAQYNCTLMGCVSAQTATYPNLQTCQAACVGWGCPPQLTTNTNIIFAYDGSGSYQNATSRLGMFKSATAWTETLTAAGWVGTEDHTIMPYNAIPCIDSPTCSNSTNHYVNVNGALVSITWTQNYAEDWLFHGSIPYVLTNQENGTRNIPTQMMDMLYNGSENEIPMNVQQQYFSTYSWRATLQSNDLNVNTGATYPSVPTLVVSFMHQASNYNADGPRFKEHYSLWSDVRASSPNPDYHKAFLFPVKNICQKAIYWETLQQTIQTGIQSILNGNQDDVTNGGTGTLDGTWITYTNGQTMPNGNVCNKPYCTTTPFGPATQNPCVENIGVNCGISWNSGNEGTFCYWSDTPVPHNPQGYAAVDPFWSITDGTNNPSWIAGQPTWGGLQDKGWGINVSLLGTDSALLANALDSSVGTVATPATICLSAETLWSDLAQIEYPYETLQNCNNNCFPYLDPWWCPTTGGGCTQDPAGTFGWVTSIPAGPYATNQDAYTACTAACNTVTAWTCSNYGCTQDTGGIFSTLESCTASCQSYSCTTNGCYGPFQGTGETGTYLEISSCTATCYHYECVTDMEAVALLPNIYDAGTSSTYGCIQTSGSVNTNISTHYSTLSACTGSCVSWGCCEPTSIGPDSVMYVYYDITSMNPTQTTNAIKGIIDWTEGHPEFTGHTYHLLWWTERWLSYASFPYTKEVWRFGDTMASSFPGPGGVGVTYEPRAQFGSLLLGSSSSYWTSSNSPANVLATVYNNSTGFDEWIDPVNYTGNSTHSIADSFAPNADLGNWRNQATGYYTRGYDAVQTASTASDVINVIFQDESYNMYQPSNATWGAYPKWSYKNDHHLYMGAHDAVTATTAGGGAGGNLRNFLYPTLGATAAGPGFALHSVAAIHSGDLTPRNGLWSATTYPKDNVAGHAQCEFNLSYLSQSSTGVTGLNPYWTQDSITASTTGHWGGLDGYGWSINFRFDTYSASVFETDLTSFMTGSSLSCSTICVSANTAQDGRYPFSSNTLCEGFDNLAACTGCTKFDCGTNGCYVSGIGTGATGQYDCLSACTASCTSYSCTDTGCTEYNQPTGTTFPYTAIDGVSYYSYYGSGGQFADSALCQLDCVSWDCGPNGCYVNANGTGGTYSSQTECEESPCSGYTCSPNGCTTFIGDGSVPMAAGQSIFTLEIDCLTGCTYWECDTLLGCISHTGTTPSGPTIFQTQTGCTDYCASFNCGNNGCYQLSNLAGTYQDITQLPVVSSAACTASCVSYNCSETGCTTQTGSGGTYSTSATCTASCLSYTCTTAGCETYNSPTSVNAPNGNYGTGGTWTASTACTPNCVSWYCPGPNGCYSAPGTGGTYTSQTQCYSEGFHPTTGVCTTYDCTATGCIAISGNTGQFNTLNACTGVCTSYSCETGTYGRHDGGESPLSWSGGGCEIYNAPNYGTGGTFLYDWQCTGGCRSWDCTNTGCTEVSLSAGTGGTYLTAVACDSGCTSWNCVDTGCTSQVGSGGTWFSSKNTDWGLTACTGTCISYNCADWGCLPSQTGSGGTYFNVDAAVSALTSCTASCLSYECFTAGCVTYHEFTGLGTGGTYSAMSACTACTGTDEFADDCPCISWGCLHNPTYTNTKIYAYYDTSSMSLSAVQDAITGLENWTTGFQNYTGSIYHTLVNDERWLSWASSVYTASFGAGVSTMFQNPIAMLTHDWASGQSMTNVYDNMAPGQSTFLFPGITTTGPAPAASNNDNILVVAFIDESGPGAGFSGPNGYTSDETFDSDVPDFSALTANPLDQPTPSWVIDYAAFSATYATVGTGTGSLTSFIYPTESNQPQTPDNQLFALHVVAAIDTGNQSVGAQGENWQSGTAPRRAVSGGVLGGTPELCSIADLTALEISNPYLTYPIGVVGNLDTQGWGYNISFGTYTSTVFQNDLESFLNTTHSSISVCVSANTSPTTQYPYVHMSACTAECYSFECTVTGCVPYNGTGGTPSFYSTLNACQSACTSWSCTTTGCTEQAGTGGTYTLSGNCTTACTSYNCEDITPYTLSSAWPLADGCIQQIGSGGTYHVIDPANGQSSFSSYSACTGDCRSYNCVVNCTGGTTGCTEWPNTAATYVTSAACTANCSVDWYCTEEYTASTCDGQTILGVPGGIINNGYYEYSPANISNGYGALGWFADNAQNATWANYSFSMGPGPHSQTGNACPGPWIDAGFGPVLPGFLHTLNSVTFFPMGTYSNSITWPRTYTSWASLVNDFVGLGVAVNLSMSAFDVFNQITGNNTQTGVLLWDSLEVSYDYSPCTCYEVPCDVFCDDGSVIIPSTAQGPFTTSGAAESACCTQVSWSCITATTLDSCSGKTTLPGQFASNTNAWDYLTVNLPNANLSTLKWESTTPAINISGACEGPNGGALYDVEPVSYPLLSTSVSYNIWNLFINQLQGAGTTGVLSGMSYSNVNAILYAQSGETLQVCEELCRCSVTPCHCLEIWDNQNPGPYLTQEDCMSGTSNLIACCPETGYTGTSWECVSGITWAPICTTKPYLGHFNDEFEAVDHFRQFNQTGTFGQKRFTDSYNINSAGVQVPGTIYTWLDVWSSISAATNDNPGVVNWEHCYKEITFSWTWINSAYVPYQYIKNISHPAINGGQLYTDWNGFYTDVATSFTVNTTMTALDVCNSIDAQYWGSNLFGCVVETNLCCNRADCYCYELYDNTGSFSTEAPCLTACCPTYTGWTCEMIDPVTGIPTYSLPCSFISQSTPITGLYFTDNLGNGFDGQTECNNDALCEPIDYWSCVTTEVNTCDPNGDSLGEITGTTNGPAIAIDNIQYPFSSSTDQLFPLLQPLVAVNGYVGGYGQVETILTDYHYFDPNLPLSSVTFQLGSIDFSTLTVVDPNSTAADLPLPYTLPAQTCYGVNATGGTGMPMFSIMNVSHRHINNFTPYNSWAEFITAASTLGYLVTNNTSIADFGLAYPLLFGCSETIINTQSNPGSSVWFSGCNWSFEMLPCLCDTTCCCESGFTAGYTSQIDCEHPITGCCPTLSSYTCTITGCIDPGNGSGEFTGLTALVDCEAVCAEWRCMSSSTFSDTCGSKLLLTTTGAVPNIAEYAPSFPFAPYQHGPWDAAAYFANAANGLQGQTFSDYKWECQQGCSWSTTDCDAPNGAWKVLQQINLVENLQSGGQTGPILNSPYTTWQSLITDLNNTYQVGNTTFFTLSQSYNDVAQLLDGGIPSAGIQIMLEMIPVIQSCYCTSGSCDCVLTAGTGTTGYYHLVTGHTQCLLDCCSGITIPECGILITGQEEGVLYYDFATNATTKLFDEPGWERLDIAARQNKLWVYRSIGASDVIREYDVVWAPFQKVFNRDITVGNGLGRGLTATEDPNILITATDFVYKLDITTTIAVDTQLFPLPSGLTCTGDIMYDNVTGNMIITYGTGATQYVGKFDGSPLGIPLEESHINTTTIGIGVNESIDSLFNYGTWTTNTSGYMTFNQPYNGPMYGITTERRVIELLTNPLQFAPLETQTLTLVNQITNKVHGAANIINIVNGQVHGCVDISGTSTDKWWCHETLGCLSYPPNVTPPNSYGPHIDQLTCEDHCNFVCGDCVGSCECALVLTPLGMGCHVEPTMIDCIAHNQSNPNVFEGGDGCCDCFACSAVTFDYYVLLTSSWSQQTIITNLNTWGNFASTWNSGIVYSVGDVVMYTDPGNNTCCYTLVYGHYNTNQTPHSAWTEYQVYIDNGIPVWPGSNNTMSWIACDPDCPTPITWNCVTGTTVSQSSCDNATDTGAMGLSYGPQISYIAAGGYTLWNTQFEDLKWDCASNQNPLPPNPCVAPIGHWAKIIACRITQIGGTAPNPLQGALKTTWADFIDLLNSILVMGGIYNFPYSEEWSEINIVMGNNVTIECIWEYCTCTTLSGPPACNMCDCNVMIYPGGTPIVPMIDISTTYYGGALGDGTPPYNYFDLGQARDIITNPANGLFNVDFREMKWAKMPLGGCGTTPFHPHIPGCTQTTYNNNGWTDCDPGEPCLDNCNGNFNKFYGGWALNGGHFPPHAWMTWGSLLNDVSTVINIAPGVPTSALISLSDTWDEFRASLEWYYIHILNSTALAAAQSIGTPYRRMCGCSATTTNYQPCHCEPVFGTGGAYPTSAICEDICCSAETSWSCVTGTSIVVSDSPNCHSRHVALPGVRSVDNPSNSDSPVGYIANPANGYQTTLLTDLKFVMGVFANHGSHYTQGTCTYGPNCFPTLCYDLGIPGDPYWAGQPGDWQHHWDYMTEIFATAIWGSPISTLTSWEDFIHRCVAPPHNLPVTINMTSQQVSNILVAHNYSPVLWRLHSCDCEGGPCGCVEITGSTGYPTSASCEVVCCTADTAYKCTIAGCIQDPTGVFTTLTDCEAVCKEWECNEGSCIGSCDTGGSNTPRTQYPGWFFGIPEDIISYVANPVTAPVQSPLLPPIINNMQQADIRYYKFDCVNCGSSTSICDSPHGKWFGPTGMWIKNIPGLAAFTYSGPHFTWEEVIDALNIQGFSLNYTTPLSNVEITLAADGRQIEITGMPCYGQNNGCDCIEIPGTGHTGAFPISDYNLCYTACCSGDTYDCTLGGCIPNTIGTGAYNSLSTCTGDCREWECISGTPNYNTCSGQTFLNIDWLNTATNYTPTVNGGLLGLVLAYFADSTNGLQYQVVSDYIHTNQLPPQWGNHCTVGNQPWTPAGVNATYGLYRPQRISAAHNSQSDTAFRFTNATNYDPVTQTCVGSGCYFDRWADLITGCQMEGVINAYTQLPINLNSSLMEVKLSLAIHFGAQGAIVRLTCYNADPAFSCPCYCSGTACYCNEVPGTGHTNYWSSQSDCDAAANATPCCVPPDELWYCEPQHTHPGGPQSNCICVQGPAGIHYSLQDCKDFTGNCCDRHYYDCLNQGTPQAGCVGLANNVVGQYQTAQLCDDDCPKVGYNCEWVLDDSPIPTTSGSWGCISCVGVTCQYTYLTAAGTPYFGDALAQCQSNCPGHSCWKCCMDHNGWITQLLPSLPPAQCNCPAGSVEVLCDGSGPCPHPVSCIPGYTYSWTLCQCVCEPNMSCAVGYHWSYTLCTCVPNIIGPVDFVGSQGEVLQSISEFVYQPVKSIINTLMDGVELLEYYTKKNYSFGGECNHCTDGTEGICVLDGCLYFVDYTKYGTQRIGWKSLLLDGTTLTITTTSTAAISTTTTTGGPYPNGTPCYACINNQIESVLFPSNALGQPYPSCAPTAYGYQGQSNALPGGAASYAYPSIWSEVSPTNCGTGCANITYDATCPFNSGGPNNTQHNDGCSTIDGNMPNSTHVGTYATRPGSPNIWKILAIGAQNTTNAGHAYTSTECTSGPTGGYSCVDNPDNPPTYTECIQYGSAAYMAYYGNTAPQYPTLQDCYAAGCDYSGTVYYMCTTQLNNLVGENQKACVPVEDGIGGFGLFTSLESCLNSGCAGWMTCDINQVTVVNGVTLAANTLYPIPMCCESYISTSTQPLTVTDCENHCSNMNEPWFPLYNVIGINTYYESPLGYLLRELNPYVRNNTCTVMLDPDTYISLGYTTKPIYDINY